MMLTGVPAAAACRIPSLIVWNSVTSCLTGASCAWSVALAVAPIAFVMSSDSAARFGAACAASTARSTWSARFVTDRPALASSAASAPRRVRSRITGSRKTTASIT